jgi:hypothetical protein
VEAVAAVEIATFQVTKAVAAEAVLEVIELVLDFL